MIYQNDYIYIDVEKSEIPWLKIFTKEPYKEFSECDSKTREQILLALDLIEKAYNVLDCERVYSALKFDIRKNRKNRLEGKIESVKKRTGKEIKS